MSYWSKTFFSQFACWKRNHYKYSLKIRRFGIWDWWNYSDEFVIDLLVHKCTPVDWFGWTRRQHPYLVVRKRFHLAKNSYDISNTYIIDGIFSTRSHFNPLFAKFRSGECTNLCNGSYLIRPFHQSYAYIFFSKALWKNENKSCLNELKFWKVSENPK